MEWARISPVLVSNLSAIASAFTLNVPLAMASRMALTRSASKSVVARPAESSALAELEKDTPADEVAT
ncbi:hypothetical protein D3C72_2532930 [compost metagenome]